MTQKTTKVHFKKLPCDTEALVLQGSVFNKQMSYLEEIRSYLIDRRNYLIDRRSYLIDRRS